MKTFLFYDTETTGLPRLYTAPVTNVMLFALLTSTGMR